MRHVRRNRNRRGSALSLAIIVSVVITGLVMTMAWSAGVQASMATGVAKMDGAYYAAEAGVQKVAWYCKNNKIASITSPLTGTIGGYAYSASWATVSGTTIRITCRASLGNVAYTCSQTVVPPPVVLPTFSTGGDFDNKNINITGSMVTGGAYSNGGSGSISGDLTYGTTVTNYTGSSAPLKAPYTALDMSTLGPYLIGYAQVTYTGTQTNKTFDFTTLTGTKKVIYVNGDLVNPTFNGSGTIYVNGSVTNLGSFGTGSAPVNIVADGNVTTNSGTFYGTIYASGAWNRSKVVFTGLVFVNGISPTNPGASTMVMTTPPWFDPRVDPSGRPLTKFIYFAGPMP